MSALYFDIAAGEIRLIHLTDAILDRVESDFATAPANHLPPRRRRPPPRHRCGKRLHRNPLQRPHYSATGVPFNWLNRDGAVELQERLAIGYVHDKEPMERWIANGTFNTAFYAHAGMAQITASAAADETMAAGKAFDRDALRVDGITDPESRIMKTGGGFAQCYNAQATVEPVFGIVKEAMGFRSFHLRGLDKAGLEWKLGTLAYNLKRIFHLGGKLHGGTGMTAEGA